MNHATVTASRDFQIGDEIAFEENGIKKRGVVATVRRSTIVLRFYDKLDDGSLARAFIKGDPMVELVSVPAATEVKGKGTPGTPMLDTKPVLPLPTSRLCKHCGEAIEVLPGGKPVNAMRDHSFRCPKRPPRKPRRKKEPALHEVLTPGKVPQVQSEPPGGLEGCIRYLGGIVEEFSKRGMVVGFTLRAATEAERWRDDGP